MGWGRHEDGWAQSKHECVHVRKCHSEHPRSVRVSSIYNYHGIKHVKDNGGQTKDAQADGVS